MSSPLSFTTGFIYDSPGSQIAGWRRFKIIQRIFVFYQICAYLKLDPCLRCHLVLVTFLIEATKCLTKTLKSKGLFWLTKLYFSTAGQRGGRRWHYIWSLEAEAGECCNPGHFPLLIQSRTPASGMVTPTLMVVLLTNLAILSQACP